MRAPRIALLTTACPCPRLKLLSTMRGGGAPYCRPPLDAYGSLTHRALPPWNLKYLNPRKSSIKGSYEELVKLVFKLCSLEPYRGALPPLISMVFQLIYEFHYTLFKQDSVDLDWE